MTLSQVVKAGSRVPQVSVLDTFLFVIYVNDLTDDPTIDHLLYAVNVKLMAPREQVAVLQACRGKFTRSESTVSKFGKIFIFQLYYLIHFSH